MFACSTLKPTVGQVRWMTARGVPVSEIVYRTLSMKWWPFTQSCSVSLSCVVVWTFLNCTLSLQRMWSSFTERLEKSPVTYSFWRRGLQYLHGMRLWHCLSYGVLLRMCGAMGCSRMLLARRFGNFTVAIVWSQRTVGLTSRVCVLLFVPRCTWQNVYVDVAL